MLGMHIVRGRKAYVRTTVPAGHPAFPEFPDGVAYIEYANGERDEVPLFVLQDDGDTFADAQLEREGA